MLTDPVNHVDAVVETFHQLALGFGGAFDEQLRRSDKLARLVGQ